VGNKKRIGSRGAGDVGKVHADKDGGEEGEKKIGKIFSTKDAEGSDDEGREGEDKVVLPGEGVTDGGCDEDEGKEGEIGKSATFEDYQNKECENG